MGRMVDLPEVEIRVAVPDDEPPVCRCVADAYEHYVERIGKPPAPMLDDYSTLIAEGVVRVATIDGKLVGVIVMWAKAKHFYIDNIAVHPDAQGHGIGAALLALADHEALASGRSEIRLYTNEAMNENIDYYPRRGFVETHRTNDAGYQRVYFTRHLPSVST